MSNNTKHLVLTRDSNDIEEEIELLHHTVASASQGNQYRRRPSKNVRLICNLLANYEVNALARRSFMRIISLNSEAGDRLNPYFS